MSVSGLSFESLVLMLYLQVDILLPKIIPLVNNDL